MRNVLALRAAARQLKHHKSFAVGVVAILGIGIGLAAAVVVVAEALLVRRLPVREQDRLVVLWGAKRDGTTGEYPVGLQDAKAFETTTRALQNVAAYNYEGAAETLLRDGDAITRMRGALVSGDFFDVLGARPVLGRALSLEDDRLGALPVIVLTHATWERRFGRDPDILGRKLVAHSSGTAYTIVGVMSRGLEFPQRVEFWAATHAVLAPENLQYVAVNFVARLSPGATPAAARDELTTFYQSPAASPWQREFVGVVTALPDVIVGETRRPLLVFAGAAVLLLLITCMNAANLLLVRGLARVREVAVRTALGASRLRVTRLLLAENVMLALLGGVVALPIAALAIGAFVVFAPPGTPRVAEISFAATGYAIVATITVAAFLLFGLAPAIATASTDTQHALKSGARETGSRSRRASEWLVAVQVTLAFVVLAATALITRSLVNLQRQDLAFDASRLLVAELALSSQRYGGVREQSVLLDELLRDLRSMPGVRAVSPVVARPFSGRHGWDGRPATEGQTPALAAANPWLNMEVIAPAYFETFGLAVLRGRAFDDRDRRGAPAVAILSETAARQYWPGAAGGDAIGKKLYMGAQLEDEFTVVGVVRDTRYRDLRQPSASIYFPLAQSFFPFAPNTLVLRADVEPASLVPAMRRLVTERYPGVALAAAGPFEDYMAGPMAQPRLNVFLLSAFAVAAMLLAASGLFGIMMLMVRQRTREIGVRMALGAQAVHVRRLVFGRAFVVAGVGLAFGLGVFALVNRTLSAMLYGITPTDAATLLATVTIVCGTVAVAAFIPARASVRIDPVEALRADE